MFLPRRRRAFLPPTRSDAWPRGVTTMRKQNGLPEGAGELSRRRLAPPPIPSGLLDLSGGWFVALGPVGRGTSADPGAGCSQAGCSSEPSAKRSKANEVPAPEAPQPGAQLPPGASSAPARKFLFARPLNFFFGIDPRSCYQGPSSSQVLSTRLSPAKPPPDRCRNWCHRR